MLESLNLVLRCNFKFVPRQMFRFLLNRLQSLINYKHNLLLQLKNSGLTLISDLNETQVSNNDVLIIRASVVLLPVHAAGEYDARNRNLRKLIISRTIVDIASMARRREAISRLLPQVDSRIMQISIYANCSPLRSAAAASSLPAAVSWGSRLMWMANSNPE